jgi:hypothetical protein
MALHREELFLAVHRSTERKSARGYAERWVRRVKIPTAEQPRIARISRIRFQTEANKGTKITVPSSRSAEPHFILFVIFCSERFVRGALPFDFAQGKLGGALLDPCYLCNPWLIPFRREAGDDFFEVGLPPCKRIFPDSGNPG